MKESGYYAPGTEFLEYAPWNQVDPPEKEFEVTCSQTLSKNVTVVTDNYIPVDYTDWDDMGGFHEHYDDTSNVNWKEEYHDNDYHTPLQLIELFGKYLKDELDGTQAIKRSESYLKSLMEECNNWIEDECEIFEN